MLNEGEGGNIKSRVKRNMKRKRKGQENRKNEKGRRTEGRLFIISEGEVSEIRL